jgi:hypothetical protein
VAAAAAAIRGLISDIISDIDHQSIINPHTGNEDTVIPA